METACCDILNEVPVFRGSQRCTTCCFL